MLQLHTKNPRATHEKHQDSEEICCDTCARHVYQARKRSTKINFLGPETARWGGGLPREGVVAEKFVPTLETLSSLGFEGRESGMSREFCRDVPDPWRCSKSLCNKKLRVHFSFPKPTLWLTLCNCLKRTRGLLFTFGVSVWFLSI